MLFNKIDFVMINFNQMNADWPQRRIGKNHDLCRAVGLNKYSTLSILDATAGLARDAFILAKLGANVTMLERHPTLAHDMTIALENFNHEHLKKNLTFIFTDAIDYLTSTQHFFDIVYLDPMFAKIDKRSKAKKDMQVLQDIVKENLDADQLLALALNKAKKRVVVKRHKLSTFLNNQRPSYQIIGKSTRYDVYIISYDIKNQSAAQRRESVSSPTQTMKNDL